LAEQEPQQFDRWSRPDALSRRGYLLAVLVPLVIAAAGFGIVSLVASDEPELSGTTVLLPTSDWEPGDDSMTAQIQGVLRMDEEHCVYLESPQGPVYAVWPAGWRATREGEALTLYDANTRVVASGGDSISTGGGYVPVETYAGEPCLPDDGDVAAVQDEVIVLQGG
jgi:hypothetical protein